MPANTIRINLLGTQDLDHTPWGRIINWATTYGRYIMITTEIVVLLAFISRFSLDRKNTDLTEELTQKQAIIEANVDFEKDIKMLQNKLASAKNLMANQKKPVELVSQLEQLIPADVYLISLDIASNRLTTNAIAGSTSGFAQFLSNLESTDLLRNVTIGDINRSPSNGIEFTLTADLSLGAVKK